MEYFVIMRDPPKGGYKSRKENQIRGWNKNWGKDTQEKVRTQLGITGVLLGPQMGSSTVGESLGPNTRLSNNKLDQGTIHHGKRSLQGSPIVGYTQFKIQINWGPRS